jgi:hypothetical protein
MDPEKLQAEIETEEEGLRRKLQRDVNCLYDPDRAARRRAITKIKRVVVDDAPTVRTRGEHVNWNIDRFT